MKHILFLLFLVMMLFNLAAKEHNFSIGGSLGLLNGQAEETVYRASYSNYKLSELLWNFEPLTYAGLDIKYSWLKPGNRWGFFTNGSFKLGFPGETGVMEDRDWMTLNSPNWLTHYSVHNNKTKSANLTDLNLGASFLIFKKFLLKTYISYHYMYFSWAASGGSILYPTWDIDGDGESDGDHYYFPFYNIGTVGTYEQTWHIVSPAISFYGEFNRFFDIEISFGVTPFIWCASVDHHLLRDLVVTDDLKGGVFIEPSLLFSYKPSDHFVLSFSFTYREISETRGDGIYKYVGEPSFTATNQSGAGYKAFDIGIIAKYRN
jgi:outer membrane protease